MSLSIFEINKFAVNTENTIGKYKEKISWEKVSRSYFFFLKAIEKGDVYGASTGFGGSSSNRFDSKKSTALQNNLMRYHGCGVGENFSEDIAAATLLCRLNCLTQGYSGVSPELIEAMLRFAEKRIFPVMPSIGSVGASGDLTPLSYLAAALAGERQVYMEGEVVNASQALMKHGIEPYMFGPREALATMNGTSVMTGIACRAWQSSFRTAGYAALITSCISAALNGFKSAFHPLLHSVKPHAGQRIAAGIMYGENGDNGQIRENGQASRSGPIQDVYSLRCAPQVIGVLYDAILDSKRYIETEANSVNDNPIFCAEQEMVLNGGHFFGGHIAHAADTLKVTLANTINLLDKQVSLLFSQGGRGGLIPDNLVDFTLLGKDSCLHHGFKAMQITLSAITAEAIKASGPMSIFTRPTESSNQDVVSMGTSAAKDWIYIAKLAENAVAITAMMIGQVFHLLRENKPQTSLSPKSSAFLSQINKYFKPVAADRPLDEDIQSMQMALNKEDAKGIWQQVFGTEEHFFDEISARYLTDY